MLIGFKVQKPQNRFSADVKQSKIDSNFTVIQGQTWRCAVQNRIAATDGNSVIPVSYTHLDVYKRQS